MRRGKYGFQEDKVRDVEMADRLVSLLRLLENLLQRLHGIELLGG